ncbi:MAG: cardiolipin synthase ClsB [Burkholderiaceae bacterium]|nr:cardiolipin synthase ClsB [Burkholderiaceae bacterium]
MSVHWTSGNAIQLLENGEAYFPAVFEAIRQAQHTVLIETFIVFEDKVGFALQRELIAAAERGVRIDMLVDGYGTADLTPAYIHALTSVGVSFHVYDPQPRLFGVRTNLFRRMHRKIVVVDSALAFVGGINFSADHLGDFGPTAKQDYAISLAGPIVKDITEFMLKTLLPVKPRSWWQRLNRVESLKPMPVGDTRAALVIRDNDHHTSDIEIHYRMGIRAAKQQITIANAYFFPGYRLLRDLRKAAKRGVKVKLILQGEPDMPIARFAATMLYDYLLSAGVEIYEYCERPLHGKVATVDGLWSTVGSSNLDPLSMALNLEANVMLYDRAFSTHLQHRLDALVEQHCHLMTRTAPPKRRIQRVLVGTLVFHFLRRFPIWVRWFPLRTRVLISVPPVTDTSETDTS